MTTGTELARLGIAPQLAPRMLRNARIETTMEHDVRRRVKDAAAPVAQLPDLAARSREVPAAAVGDQEASSVSLRQACRS